MNLSKLLSNRNLINQAAAVVWKRNIILAVLVFSLFSVWSVAAQSTSPCLLKPIAYGDTKNGTLTTGSCVANSKYVDNYFFSATAGDQIAIAMNAGTLSDPYIELLDGQQSVIAFNDDGGGNRNSLLYYTIQSTGSYVIRATTYAADDTGTYTLTLNTGVMPPPQGSPSPSPQPCTANPISYGETAQGSISFSCYVNERPTELYTFSGNAGDQIAIALNSSPTFYSSLELVNSQGTSVAASSGETLDSRIPSQGYFTLPATDTYTIRAIYNQAAQETSSFPFTLSLSKLAPCPVTPISYGQTVTGILTTDSCVINNKYTDLYSFSGVAGQQIEIRMDTQSGGVQRPQAKVRPFNDAVSLLKQVKNSAQATPLGDPYLELVDEQGNVIASDDNSGGYPNARIPSEGYYTLPSTGTFTIRATTAYSGDTGEYTLSLNLQTCSESLDPTSANIPAGGGTYNFNVTTNRSGCGYTAVSNQSWVTVNTGSGTDSGSISYTVAQNTTTVARTAVITVSSSNSEDSDTFTITQEAACSFAINPTSAFVPAPGGSGSFAITVLTGSGCGWTAVSNQPWITTSSSGTGNGTINYSVAVNTTTVQRTGTITVGGQTFTITQEAACSFGINPTSADYLAAGGNGSFAITVLTGSGCSWTAVSNQPWITTSSSGTGNGTTNYSVAENTTLNARTGTITVGGQTFTVRQAAVVCTYSINPTNAFVPANGGNFSFALTTNNAGCTWTATSNNSFITTTSAGTGNGTINYSVAVNTATVQRSGTITVAGQTFTVTQEAACSFAINPTSAFVPAAGGSGSFAITVLTGSGCNWTAVSNQPWITTSSAGTGNGTINYSVAVNTATVRRTGTITVGGQTFTITQEAACSYSITPTSNFVGEAGGTFSFNLNVLTGSGCGWTAVSNSAFITTSSSGTGSGVVNYAVAVNPTTVRRSGTITVAGLTFTVTQEAACSFSISPTNASYKAAGGNGSFAITVLTGSGCGWTAVSNQPWITTTSAGTGNGTINYSVGENTTLSPRTGTIAVGGQTFTITQQAPATCSSNAAVATTANSIAYGQTYIGTLSSTSCEPNTIFNDLFNFSGVEGDRIVITMESAFFPTLELLDSSGNVIQSVSGSTRMRNVRLPAAQPYFVLPTTGIYSIRAAGNFLGEAGDYSLSLYKLPTAPCTYKFSPAQKYVPSTGGIYSVYVLTQNDCPPVSLSDLHIDANRSVEILSNIDGLIYYRVAANSSPADRQFTISINGSNAAPFQIYQYGNRAPSNDFFAGAIQLSNADTASPTKESAELSSPNSPADGPINGFNTGATSEANETAHAGSAAAKSIWYKWTPAPGASGLYSFTTSGSDFDTVMDIYACPTSGVCSLTNITTVGSNDNTTRYDKTSKVNFRAIVGTTYYIVIDGKNGAEGTVQLVWQQYERLYRLYLQNYNGNPSPLTPDSVVAVNGNRIVPGTFISQGVYEFNLPADKTVYRVNIKGPEGIVWDPNNIPLDDSFSALNKPAENETQLNQPSDDPPSGGQNVVSNATNATPRFITGFIKNITGQELPLLSVKIGFSQGANPRDPINCATVDSPIGTTPFVTYQCITQPNTLHDIIPNMVGKSFTLPVKSFPFPIVNDEFGLPSNALVASNSATFNISGRVLDGGAGTTVDLIYTPTGTAQSISLRTTTDSNGFYEFKNLSTNTYTVQAKRTGYIFNQPPTVNLQSNVTGLDISSQNVCSYIPPAVINTIPATGGTGQFTITTNNPTCEFTAGTSESFIVINSGATVGSGPVFFTVDPNNTGAVRTGVIRVQGQNITIRQESNTTSTPNKKPLFDFDGDGKADVSVFRPTDGTWYLLNSTAGFSSTQFGQATDKIVPADYDGDGKTDIAVFRNNTWFLQRSTLGFTSVPFGSAGDIPAPADFNGDGKAELAVFRPTDGTWYIFNLTTNAVTSVQFGSAEDKPVVGDYDGDGKADQAVFRPSNGTWFILKSRDGFTSVQFGNATDKPAVGDYDGDGKADQAVFRPSNGTWFIFGSALGFTSTQFGLATDIPAPADYDGDGKTDLGLFRPEISTWFLMRSTQGFASVQFGANGDKPVPNAFVP